MKSKKPLKDRFPKRRCKFILTEDQLRRLTSRIILEGEQKINLNSSFNLLKIHAKK
jgi:hypothetical protein